MKNKIGDKARLHHIFDAILEIEKYTQNQTYDDFFNNSMLQSACIRQLEIVGLRNILIHDYFGVDLDIVWQIIQSNIPQLKTNIEVLINKFDKK